MLCRPFRPWLAADPLLGRAQAPHWQKAAGPLQLGRTRLGRATGRDH